MNRTLLLLIPALLLSGCGSKENIPFLGRWKADFVVDRMTVPGTEKDQRREGLHGYLQVYQTGLKFKMRLEGEQEAIDGSGTWSHKGNHVTLTFTDLKIDDMGGAQHRDPNLKFILPAAIQAAYQRELTLNMSPDKKTLNGLDVTIGNLVGRHVFTRSLD
jgi:hypothetical protein